MTRVLIAHQSGIPHYRVPFYNELVKQAPANLHFDVVEDPHDVASLELAGYQDPRTFTTLNVNTYRKDLFGLTVRYQTYLNETSNYDLVILEHALNNLSYPLTHLRRSGRLRLAYWGHGRDVTVAEPKGLKVFLEALKLWLAKRAAGYFAYTQGVKVFLVEKGLHSDKIFVVNNTIDIRNERRAFNEFSFSRQEIRQKLDLTDARVLLFVGRFTSGKRLDFLLDSFLRLYSLDDSYRLLLVGSGDLPPEIIEGFEQVEAVLPLGMITNRRELAPVYVASDLFVYPGDVGLSPLQAFCYNLPAITIASSTHKPEFEYLNTENAVILPSSTTVEEYAQSIHAMFTERERLERLAETAWPSISHLTIEDMASRFLVGIDRILKATE